jgi:hypothetical protein
MLIPWVHIQRRMNSIASPNLTDVKVTNMEINESQQGRVDELI